MTTTENGLPSRRLEPNSKRTSICLFGAAPDTGNLGVSALCHSVVGGIAQYLPGAEITVFDYGRGLRTRRLNYGSGVAEVQCCGGSNSRRLWRRDTLWNIRLSAWFGGLGSAAVRCLRECDAILDISGGDSFTDLYGSRRFRGMSLTKLIALELGKPLVLLPQTYGPYQSSRALRLAGRIVRRATMAFARDPRSFEVLCDLAGADCDSDRYLESVDVAFALQARRPEAPLPARASDWLDGNRDEEVVGLNVSGLIWNEPEAAKARFGLRADYRATILGLIEHILRSSSARVLLVPHVLVPPGHFESDVGACADAKRRLGAWAQSRVEVIPAEYDACEMKWIIGRTNWFCGTRMHSAIAALSSGVPTSAIAYSIKTKGVFETCDQGQWVADPRRVDTTSIIEQLSSGWDARSRSCLTLRRSLRTVKATASTPFKLFENLIAGSR